MATSTVLSSGQTNRDAAPRVLNQGAASGGILRVAMGSGFVTTGDVSPSTYNFCPVPSNAVISSLRLFFEGTGGTTTAAHFGVWSTTQDGGGVVDNDFFATAVSLASAVNGTEIAYEAAVSGTSAFNGAEKRLWERLGLSNDPGCFYDIKAILKNTSDNSGTLGVICNYSI